jgi:DNA-binding transcriptional ArsR family regulator
MSQGELFPDGEAYARSYDPKTSHEAARHVRKHSASAMEYKALRTLREHPGGLTTHELVYLTGIPWNTISPRLAPLVRKLLVRDSGKRRKGPTNRPCIVWEAIL